MALHFSVESARGVLRANARLAQVLDRDRKALEGGARPQQRVARGQQVGDRRPHVGRQQGVDILGEEGIGRHRSHRRCNDRARRCVRQRHRKSANAAEKLTASHAPRMPSSGASAASEAPSSRFERSASAAAVSGNA